MNSINLAMKHAKWPWVLTSALAISICAVGQAQVVNKSDKAKVRTEKVKNSIAESATQFSNGNNALAEAQLLTANTSKADTAAWHRESAHRLYNLALRFRAQNQHATAQQIATQAIAQLQQAMTKSKHGFDVAEEARVMTTTGMIYDRLLGNPVAALAAYQEAMRLNPQAVYATHEAARLSVVVAEITRLAEKK